MPEMRPRKDISWRKKGNSPFVAWISGNSYVEIDFKWACATFKVRTCQTTIF